MGNIPATCEKGMWKSRCLIIALATVLMPIEAADAHISEEEWVCRGEAVKAVRVEYEPLPPRVLRNGTVATGKRMTPASEREFSRHVRKCMCRDEPWWHLCRWWG
jgi:hypothetical protein